MSRSVALVGRPHAGKSVWLGRVWHAIRSGRRQLVKRGAPIDLEPMRILGDPIEQGRFNSRTSDTAPPVFVAPLTWVGPPAVELDLHVADYAGEEVKKIWARDRGIWDRGWVERAKADGLAIVIRADRARRALDGVERVPGASRDDRAHRLFGDTQPDAGERTAEEAGPPPALEAVELLQLLRHARGLAAGELDAGWRVAVVLSAWDAVDPAVQELGPRRFIRDELGLLDDFLATNFRAEDIRAFGLSAVGGNLEDTTYHEKFMQGEVDDHGWLDWDREGVRTSTDTTLPLGWLLVGEHALPEGEPWKRR